MSSRYIPKILKEIEQQFTNVNQNSYWKDAFMTRMANAKELDLQDLHTFLESNRKHRELMEAYWPGERMTQDEKVEASASMVGFRLPKMFKSLNEDFSEESKDGQGKKDN